MQTPVIEWALDIVGVAVVLSMVVWLISCHMNDSKCHQKDGEHERERPLSQDIVGNRRKDKERERTLPRAYVSCKCRALATWHPGQVEHMLGCPIFCPRRAIYSGKLVNGKMRLVRKRTPMSTHRPSTAVKPFVYDELDCERSLSTNRPIALW